jgi:hypothetical protein
MRSHGIHAGASPDRTPCPDHLLGPEQGGGQHHLAGHQRGRTLMVAALPALAHLGCWLQ